MRTRSRIVHAFTLIELVVVVGIIGILATLAISTTVSNRPQNNLKLAVGEMRLEYMRARTLAVRSDRNVKVCFFRDDSAMALPAKGRMVVFSCNTKGSAGCPGTFICTNATAATGTQWSGTVDDPPCPDTTANQWCQETGMGFDLGSAANVDKKVSISAFQQTGVGTVSTRNSIEITIMSSGFLDTTRSNFLSAQVHLVNRDLCRGSCGSLDAFITKAIMDYTAGGGARIR